MEVSKKKKQFQFVGDIFAIIASFVLAGLSAYSIFSRNLYALIPLMAFYLFIGILRLSILILVVAMIRKNTDPVTRFKRERRICRLTGLTIIIFNSLIFVALTVLINKAPSEIITKFDFAIIGYMVYAIYKFISSIFNLYKARVSHSPYRETICFLSIIAALMTLLTMEVALVSIYGEDTFFYAMLEVISALVVNGIIFVMGIVMVISRRVPRTLKNN